VFDHHVTAFSEDGGETPAALREAVDAVRANQEDPEALAHSIAETLVSLSKSRVLVPLLTHAGDIGETPEGAIVDKTQELSIVTVSGPDGRQVMPAFTSVETMRQWNSEARPIPVPGPQLALAAAEEGTDLIILDPGTSEREFGVRRTQLQAVALGEPRDPAWWDDAVWAAFHRSVAEQPRVRGLELAPGDPEARLLGPEVVVTLNVELGLSRDGLANLVTELQRAWAADSTIVDRVDSLKVSIRAADQDPNAT